MALPGKKLTIRDIALMAGLSHTTVSRVLNGDPRVRQETQERVMEIVNSLDFKPNPLARAFSRSRSNLIGLVVSDISNTYYLEIVRGIEDEARRRGFRVVFHSTSAASEGQSDYFDFLKGVGIDGFIFISARNHEPAVEELVREGVPVVLVHRTMLRDICSTVTCNQYKCTCDMIRHLYSLGRRRIAIIVGSKYNSTAAQRLLAYQDTLKELGLPYNENYVYAGRCFRANGIEAAQQFLALSPPPDAIFASSDTVALGVMDVTFEAGLSIPEDISIVGSDDADFASNKLLSLTTINMRKYEMGSMGAQILLDMLEKGQSGYLHKVELEPRLVIRRSCGSKIFRPDSLASPDTEARPVPQARPQSPSTEADGAPSRWTEHAPKTRKKTSKAY